MTEQKYTTPEWIVSLSYCFTVIAIVGMMVLANLKSISPESTIFQSILICLIGIIVCILALSMDHKFFDYISR